MDLPNAKQKALQNIVNDLKAIDNVSAIVLGGSYATGNATATSDVDIGIYYFTDKPFDIGKIKSVAKNTQSMSLPLPAFMNGAPG